MVVDERSRHELYRWLEEVLGREAATTWIEHLPPVGWTDVATKHYLASVEQRMELRFARVDDRFAAVDRRFDRVDERFDLIDERFKGLDWRFDSLDDRIEAATSDIRAASEHELRSQTTTMVFGLVSVVMTMAALAFALVRFS